MKQVSTDYEQLLMSMYEGFIVLDGTGKIIKANQRACEILGLAMEELMNRTTTDSDWQVVHKDGSIFPFAEQPPAITLKTNNPQHNVVMGILKPDKTQTWILANSFLLNEKNDTTTEVAVTFTDITALKQAEDQTLQNEERLEMLSLVASTTDNIVVIANAKGQIEWVNQSFTKVTGYELAEVVGKTPGSFLHGPLTSPADAEAIRNGIQNQQHVSHEILNYAKDGHTYWAHTSISPVLDKNGNVKKFISIERDITDRHRYEDELARYKQAVDAATDHIVITDKEGIVLYANDAATKATGYTRSEILGTKAGTLWGKLMDKQFYDEMWHRLLIEKSVFTGEITNTKKSGEKYVVEVNLSPVLDQKGNVTYIVGIERDITRQKEIDNMKTDFISLASHQLRTPLTSIRWLLELLIEESRTFNSSQSELVHKVYTSTLQMIELVGTLLNISRIESNRVAILPRSTNLRELIRAVLEEVNPNKDHLHNISLSIEDSINTVNVDPGLLRQVYMNFLTNALKYSPPDKHISIWVYRKNGMIETAIQDQGYGIPEHQKKRVFERFFRAENITEKVTEGTGLGLYLIKLIVEAFGGSTWFDSKENEGSTFWFTFPECGMQFKKGSISVGN